MQKAVRLAGRITEWDDAKGYGFVVPNGGGDRAFVHISGFPRGSRRPVQGDQVSYLPGRDERGRLQARQPKLAGRPAAPAREASNVPRTVIGLGALAAATALVLAGPAYLAIGLAYLVASAIAYLLYWADKSSAVRGGRRIAESTLHLASLLGGWPGALLAQQQFRHKTIKQPFQSVFWVTVVANLGMLAWLVYSGAAAGLPA
ncbi:MAG: DUF1294 domain-containing protein [Marinobacter sp.]|uniref:DUF1294 domain-containing protein n=1 Tax=Marinobacter sp. TaxID=50741 RepID=UPI0029C55653|nr:DUF1294 domain-containing protein [Marinobacter sp.]MDX5385550.1 DUF1294 domain-containing protein [Marinobacter sp.]